MKYDARRTNMERAIKTYSEVTTILGTRFEGEVEEAIRLNSRCVLDGLRKIIKLKEEELKKYSEENN